VERNERIRENRWCQHATRFGRVPFDLFLEGISKATSFTDYAKRARGDKDDALGRDQLHTLLYNEDARRDFNQVRTLLGLKPLRLRKNELAAFVEREAKGQQQPA
jgi:hypothetical protein